MVVASFLLLLSWLPATTVSQSSSAVWKTSATCTTSANGPRGQLSFSNAHVRSPTACESAYNELSSADDDMPTTIADSSKPPGCFLDVIQRAASDRVGITQLKFNTDFTSKTTCSQDHNCICVTVEDCKNNNGGLTNTPSTMVCNCGSNTQCIENLFTAASSTGFICFVSQDASNSGSCRNRNPGDWGYQVETQNNHCAANIATQQDCVLAATRMHVLQAAGIAVGGYENLVTTISSSQFPTGCSKKSRYPVKVYYNTKNSAKTCSTHNQCLCLTSLFFCSNNDGTVPSEIGCKCARSYPDVNVRKTFDHTVCTTATGTFCTSSTTGSTTTNTCAKPPACVYTKGNTPNKQMCTCGDLNGNEDTVCTKEMGLYCSTFTTPAATNSHLISGTCSTAPGAPPYFSLNSGQCSDIDHGQLILPPTNTRFSNKDASLGVSTCEKASVFLRLGDDKPPTEIRGTSLPGCTFTWPSLSFNVQLHDSYQPKPCSTDSKCICRTVLPCANIDGSAANAGPCQCGKVTCHDAESTGLICYICDQTRQHEQCTNVLELEGSCRKEGLGKYGYITQTSGFCLHPVGTKEICERTVKRMGFSDVSVASLTEKSDRSKVPEGCYIDVSTTGTSTLHFNPEFAGLGGSTEPLCSSDQTCVCILGNVDEAQKVEGASNEPGVDFESTIILIVLMFPGILLFLGFACWVVKRQSDRSRREAQHQENMGGIQMATQRGTNQPQQQGRVLRINTPHQQYQQYQQPMVQPIQPIQPMTQPIYPVQPMQQPMQPVQPMQQVPSPYAGSYNNSPPVTATVVRAVPIEVDSVADSQSQNIVTPPSSQNIDCIIHTTMLLTTTEATKTTSSSSIDLAKLSISKQHKLNEWTNNTELLPISLVRAIKNATSTTSIPSNYVKIGNHKFIDNTSRLPITKYIQDPHGDTLPTVPTVLLGACQDWSAFQHKSWTIEQLSMRTTMPVSLDGGPSFARQSICRGKVSLTDYERYCNSGESELDSAPLYVFDPDILKSAFKDGTLLNQEYSTPLCFEKDIMSCLTGTIYRPLPPAWLLVGAPRSGTPIHNHPYTIAWNALLSGTKLWCCLPPDVNEDLLLLNLDENGDIPDDEPFDLSAMEWFVQICQHELPPETNIIVQQPGEIVYLPKGWFHVVLNIETSTAISVSLTLRRDLLQLFPSLIQEDLNFAMVWYKKLNETKEMRDDVGDAVMNRLKSLLDEALVQDVMDKKEKKKKKEIDLLHLVKLAKERRESGN